MAAKTRTTSTKKAARRTRKTKDDVAPEPPDPMSPAVMKEIVAVETLLQKATGMTEAKLTTAVTRYSERATDFARNAVTAGAAALVYAWGCGGLLNGAKERLGHGGFGKWREKNFGDDVMSERTSQRYMKLARENDDVRNLLDGGAGLRQAYIACGVLPEPPEREPVEESESENAKRQALLSGITGMQKRLRMLVEFKGKLGDAEKTQLQLARREIDAFFDQILGDTQ